MSTTYHDSKEALVEELWQKMVEVGVERTLIEAVIAMTVEHLVGSDALFDQVEAVNKLIEHAWKCGAFDVLNAIEIGAIHNVLPKQSPGNN